MRAAETRAFVSSTIFFLLAPALPWRASRSLPTQVAAKIFEQAWLVRRAPIHSAPAVVLHFGSGRVWGPDRLVLLPSFAGTPRSVVQWQHVPVT